MATLYRGDDVMDVFEIASTMELTVSEVTLKSRDEGYSKLVLTGEPVYSQKFGYFPNVVVEISSMNPQIILDLMDGFDRVPGEAAEVMLRKA